VAQEGLDNVHKHASATAVKIEFMFTADSINMKISDNGCGFDVAKQAHGKLNGRLGLLGIHERLRLVNGSLSIASTPSRGTCISVKVPLDPIQGEAIGKNVHGRVPQACSI
jgi:signal transduction histidine kinase